MATRFGSGKRRLLVALAATAAVVAGLGTALNTVEAASSVTPVSGPAGKIVYGTYNGQTEKLQTMLFQVDLNGQPSFMFCIDISTYIEFGVSYDESSWDSSKVPNLDKIARILSQTSATTTKDPVEIAAAQSAIWHFSDGFELDVANPDNDPAVVARYQALVNDATANPVENEPAGTLSVSPSTASVAQGQPVFYDISTTSTAPLSIELSDAAVTAHPANGTTCDTASTITAVTGTTRICLTSTSSRTNVSMTIRTSAAPLSAGRVFIRPNRQKLIIGKSGQAQSSETVSATWTANGRPSVSVACPTDGIRYGEATNFKAGAVDPDGDQLTYQWFLNGAPIAGETSDYIVIALQATDKLSVTVTDAAGQTASADVTCPGKNPPTVTLACPDKLMLGGNNTFTATGTDPDGDTLTYQWTYNGQPVTTTTGPEFTTITNAGDTIEVTAVDSTALTSASVTAPCIPPKENRPPTVMLSCPTDLTYGLPATFTATGSDPDGDALTYEWKVNGTVVGGKTGPTAELTVNAGDTVSVTANDGTATSTAATKSCTGNTPNHPPTVKLTCPKGLVYGTPAEFTATGTDPDGNPLTYEWKINGAVVDGQTGATATLTVKKGDKVSVVANDGKASSTPAEETCTGTEPNQPPTVTLQCPKDLVWGSPATFTATGSDPDGDPLTYEWKINGTAIAGQSSASVTTTLKKGDVITVTAKDARGASSAAATGNCAGNSRPTVKLTCPSSVLYGEPITFTALGTDADGDPLTYVWKVNGTTVAGQTSSSATLTITKGDRINVTAQDDRGGASDSVTVQCTGTTRPTVTITCPSKLVYDEPFVFIANGVDPDGDTDLVYMWYLNGALVDGEHGPKLTTGLAATDHLTVTVTDSVGAVSAAAAADCTGNHRPTVALTCPDKLVFDQPATFTATGTDGDKDPLTYVWKVGDKVVDGATTDTATLTIAKGDRVTVTATDDSGTTSAAATSDCTGTSAPKVKVTCPATFVYDEPVMLTASATDADGDTVTYRWTLNGTVVDGVTGPTAKLTLKATDKVTVTATDATGLASAAATFDCAGKTRPKISFSCPKDMVFGTNSTIVMTSDNADVSKLVFTWAVNGKVVPGTTASNTLVLQANDTVEVTAIDADGLVATTVETTCMGLVPTSVAGTSTTPIPSTPQVLASDTYRAAAQTVAAAGALATTGSDAGVMALVALIAVGLGLGLVAGSRRRARRDSSPDDLAPNA